MIKFNLKKVMKEKNKTLKELADMTGLSINTLSLLSTGKSKGIQFDTLEKLLQSLNCNVSELIILDNGFRKLKITDFSVSDRGMFIYDDKEDNRFNTIHCSYKEEGSNEENTILLTIMFAKNIIEVAVSGIIPFDFLKSGKFYYREAISGKTKSYITLDYQFILHILKKAYKDNEKFRKKFNFDEQEISIDLFQYNNGSVSFKSKNQDEFLNSNIIPASKHLKNLVSFEDNEIKFLFNFYTEEELNEDDIY